MPALAAGSENAQRIRALLRTHLPPATANLFSEASLSADGEHIEWWTHLSGQPVAFADLPSAEKEAVRATVRDRLQQVAGLAGRVPDIAPGSADLAEALHAATRYPGDDSIYVVNGNPVITFWGHVPVAPAAAAEPVPAVPFWARIPRWLWVLLLLLLLLLLLFWLLRGCEPSGLTGPEAVAPEPEGTEIETAPEEPQPDDVAEPDGVEELEKQLAEERARYDDLRDQIADLRAQLAERLAACTSDEPLPSIPAPDERDAGALTPPDADEPPPPKTPQPKPSPPETVTAEPDEPAAPEQPAGEPPVPTTAPTPDQPPPEAAEPPPALEEETACPEPRPIWERPEIVLVLDSSGSMGLPLSVSAEEADSLIARAMAGDRAAAQRMLALINSPGRKRLDAAKDAMKSVVDGMPGDVDIGYLVFGDCDGVDNHKFFSPSQRGQLKGLIDRTRPREGTPLARGIERAGNIIDGEMTDAVIVVLSDGTDSCGGDPCAVAERIARRKPRATINVVDLSGIARGQCLASATGGQVFFPKDASEVAKAIEKATKQPSVPEECR